MLRLCSLTATLFEVEANLLARQWLPKWFPREVWSANIRVEEKPDAGVVVEYHVRTLGLLPATAAMSALLSIVFLVFLGQSVSTAAIVFALGWAWLFGGNYLAGVFLFPRWLQRGVRSKNAREFRRGYRHPRARKPRPTRP